MTLKETSEKIISSMTEQLKNEIKKEGCVNFEDTIEFLKHLETFFSITKNHTEKEIESFLDNLVKMYKNKIKAKDLTEERVRIFNDSINYLVMVLGYTPINKKGNDMSNLEFQVWKEDVWKRHLKGKKEEPKEIESDQDFIKKWTGKFKRDFENEFRKNPEYMEIINVLIDLVIKDIGLDLIESMESSDIKDSLGDKIVQSLIKKASISIVKDYNKKENITDSDLIEWMIELVTDDIINAVCKTIIETDIDENFMEELKIFLDASFKRGRLRMIDLEFQIWKKENWKNKE